MPDDINTQAAKIIDPAAFAPGALITDKIREVRQARALEKAGKIRDLMREFYG